ncbi:PREDICTED: putative F-box protein At1g49610 [Camelina sativa]|uniref:F-box protein At1g49610 n=1 Tax=Camelina sativa TaxID=90675 RepID=A0ABM1RL96_CAMSA|nr:PREDICTED: putative F-box protein At1g49610 [Camelina sativa]
MADNVGNGDSATASSVSVHPSHYVAHRRREIKRARVSREDIDSISYLPDEILQVILSFIPTKFAIRTSVLSRRWRHVWCDTPSLSFVKDCCPDRDSIGKTLARYTARKMIRFQLCAIGSEYFPDVYSWIEFAMSRNVENLWVEHHLYDVPDFFYTNSSVKQLYLKSGSSNLVPECSVSWTSLKILTLHTCNLFDESFAKILSGSPNLETLRLYLCDELYVLDLSKSPRLKTLEIESEHWGGGAKIVAPHIHSLRLRFTISDFAYSLVDVSSLTEAELDIDSGSLENWRSCAIVLKMLEKLQNVEKLTFCGNFLKALSLADRHCYSFPKLKVKVLTLKTTISKYVTSGIERVLQHSPELKKLTLRTMDYDPIIELFGLNPDQIIPEERVLLEDFYSRDVDTKYVASFMELVLKTTKTLEKMVVRLGPYRYTRRFRELRQRVPMLSHDNDVSIVLIPTKRWIRVSRWSKPNIEYHTSNLM